MKAKDIRALTTDEMLEKEKQYKEELFNLRFQQATEIRKYRSLEQSPQEYRQNQDYSERKSVRKQLMEGSY